MALYQDGILISGANTLPKMTLAEYNALPADQRPTYWERLDADYDDVLAPKTDIATVESGTTASRAYSVGELVYVSGTLYRVKTAIASGATFTVGTNIEAKNVSDVFIAVEEKPSAYYVISGGWTTIANQALTIASLSQLTGGAVTARSAVKGIAIAYVAGDSVYDYGSFNISNSGNVMYMPTASQSNVTFSFCILY